MLRILRDENVDIDGQASNFSLNRTRVSEREIDVLLGLCQGIMADGSVSLQEAAFLLDWINSNRHISDQWPANVLLKRLKIILCDGVLEQDEERELLELLMDISGVKTSIGEHTSTNLPFSHPLPEVTFEGSTFCVTGKFAVGTRREIQGEICARGGTVSKTVTTALNYLVVGEFTSRDWAHKTFGRKIERAVELQEKGHQIFIVSEHHWLESIA